MPSTILYVKGIMTMITIVGKEKLPSDCYNPSLQKNLLFLLTLKV